MVDEPPPPAESPPVQPPRRLPLVPFILLVATILVPFLFWWRNSFRRRLDDLMVTRFLSAEATSTEAQHAVTELSQRIDEELRAKTIRRTPDVKAFYPQIVALAAGADIERRIAAAWLMGDDPDEESFRTALIKLLSDPEPTVVWNAAPALAKHRSTACRDALLSMLGPYEIKAPESGLFTAEARLEQTLDRHVRIGTIVTDSARITVDSPVIGEVVKLAASGRRVEKGDVICVTAAAQSAAKNALVALTLAGIGRASDLAAVDAFAQVTPNLHAEVRAQIEATRAVLKTR